MANAQQSYPKMQTMLIQPLLQGNAHLTSCFIQHYKSSTSHSLVQSICLKIKISNCFLIDNSKNQTCGNCKGTVTLAFYLSKNNTNYELIVLYNVNYIVPLTK